MTPASVDIAGVVHTNSYLNRIRDAGMSAPWRAQAFIGFEAGLLTYGDPPTPPSWRADDAAGIVVKPGIE